jgi:hypothetical protein
MLCGEWYGECCCGKGGGECCGECCCGKGGGEGGGGTKTTSGDWLMGWGAFALDVIVYLQFASLIYRDLRSSAVCSQAVRVFLVFRGGRAKRGRFNRFRGVHRGSGVFFSPAHGTKTGPALGTKTVDFLPNLH